MYIYYISLMVPNEDVLLPVFRIVERTYCMFAEVLSLCIITNLIELDSYHYVHHIHYKHDTKTALTCINVVHHLLHTRLPVITCMYFVVHASLGIVVRTDLECIEKVAHKT